MLGALTRSGLQPIRNPAGNFEDLPNGIVFVAEDFSGGRPSIALASQNQSIGRYEYFRARFLTMTKVKDQRGPHSDLRRVAHTGLGWNVTVSGGKVFREVIGK